MLHQRRQSSQTSASNGASGGGAGLSLSMGDDNAYAAAYGGASSPGYGSSGYGYTGYPSTPSQHQHGQAPQAQQQSARRISTGSLGHAKDADKYRRRSQDAQFTYRSWMTSALLFLALVLVIFFGRYKYSSLNRRYQELQSGGGRHRHGEHANDKLLERAHTLEKQLKDANRKAALLESDKRKAERELGAAKKELRDHETAHHHESTLSEDQLALLDPEHQEYIKKKEAEFQKQFDMLTEYIQQESKREVLNWLGDGPHKVKFEIEYPEDRELPEGTEKPKREFVVQLAPLDSMPHSIHIFLEQVSAHLWDNTAFVINPGHVLQAAAVSGDQSVADRAKLKPFEEMRLKHVAFQEYNKTFPHEQWTLGFAGRPGGPDFYINTQNNTIPHGPGGQAHHELTDDADPCFAIVVDGIPVVKDLMTRPRKRGLLMKRIAIKRAYIVEPSFEHDPHAYEEGHHDEEHEEGDPAKSDNEDEPVEVPDYINHDKGYEEEA